MRSTKARFEFDTLTRRLRQWETDVPSRARRFHQIRSELEREIGGALSLWQLWISDEVVERFRDRAGRLETIAEPLVELIAEVVRLEAEVQRLADTRLPGGDELATWLRERTRDWLALLGLLGARCERDSDVSADQTLYARTERAVRLHHEALHQLAEAERVLTTVGPHGRAAVLAAPLPLLRRRLYSDGATPEWIDELKELIEPLKPVADRIQDPPRELGEAGLILTELRGWLGVFSDDAQARLDVERLAEREFRVADWSEAEAQAFVEDVQRLRSQLIARAEERRSANLRELEEGLADLRQACGDQPELDARLADLTNRPSSRPQFFRDWLTAFERFRNSFQAVAQSHIGTLETRLAGTVEGIENRLGDLELQPLSDVAIREAFLLRHDLRAVGVAVNVEDTLRQLRRVNEIARAVEHLAMRAEGELREADRQEKELTRRFEALQFEAGRVKDVELDLSTVAPRIAAFADGASHRPLEERRRQTDAVTTDLGAAEAEFVARCRVQLTEHAEAIERASVVLARAGSTPQSAGLPLLAPDALPPHAAGALLEARQRYRVVLRLARAKRDELEGRRVQARSDLENIRPDDLGPAERQRAKQLLRQLDDESRPRNQSVIDALEQTMVVVEKCEQFFEALRQEQRTALARHGELQLGFREFTDQQLNRFCPELSDRVAALIFGLPEHPRQWSAVHHQLDRAAVLFSRVRSQAQRLAAEELDRAADTLRIRLRGSADASYRELAQKLLAELDACSPEMLAPATLRQRVVNASQRQG